MLLIGADSDDDVPAKPKPAASTNAIMIERIQSSLGLDLGLRRPYSVWSRNLTKTVDNMHARYFAGNGTAFMFCSGGSRVTARGQPPIFATRADVSLTMRFHAVEQGDEKQCAGSPYVLHCDMPCRMS